MALEAVVFSEGLYGCWTMAAPAENVSGGGMEVDLEGGNAGSSTYSWDVDPGYEGPVGTSATLPPMNGAGNNAAAKVAAAPPEMSPLPPAASRRKRRRTRSLKNREELESQRMTHIAVERNRRRQMNEYLAVLRSLMPPSYVQRGDQASIIGGAINYVKELEQLLQSLEARKHARHDLDAAAAVKAPLAGFFVFPQYAMSAAVAARSPGADDDGNEGASADGAAASGSRPSDVADIEVTMVESHASLKVLSRRRPRQVLRLLAGLQGHRLGVLHLNVTSAGQMALYSLSLKVEDDCALSSVDDIAAAVHHIVEAIEQEEGEHDGCGGELIGTRVAC